MGNARYLFDDVLENKLKVEPVDKEALKELQNEWDRVAKPIGSFGTLETVYSKIAAIQGFKAPDLSNMRLIVCCGDHGIVEEGVSQTSQDVTRICATNIGKGVTTAGVMAKSLGIDILSVDVGINYAEEVPYTLNRRVKYGTCNFLKQPAMSVEEFSRAVQVGMDLVKDSQEEGKNIILVGEMGIGNTTSASVMAGYLLDLNAEAVTGRGAGLDEEGFSRKRAVVSMALSKYSGLDPVEICSNFGGLELAAMTGIVIGGALYKVPIILDGMLSMVSALVADRLLENTKDYLIPSHISKEPVARKLASKLDIEPVIDGKMAVGEGAGAVMMAHMLRLTDEVFHNALKFQDSEVEQYERFNK
ncbi:nicotinate-nucleotide-dimethylbenzimidazole phosphoribosyltransferase [Pseudobutyrivibrio sp. 49]|uniref:nicotinate-nucleotide--dimethylbenzimidazole phosphoribosyltransferase n=1 Tax=unclassified Pseudobutyrivibrio TaxID=2638619 RepID=UPI0008894DF6|nr:MULTISPECIES: nicotinate-nucleotide--dimethylbenzimidazole phosphoribosyltransferase [unclassified Pseudobutyrivibrio]SDH30125.1 nicotinate-nucleotide-dimethylbenzimidazole phosphoribosyltransferase [Pseudobutyrivibrio sp. 49]SFN50899.1 nicotinate-nucleotide-dimethylbenzimidazole phosphoribosyltransferase [Pseudobutyrivibrio sp. UC1225]